jgi:hypothetical protein
MTDVLVDPTDRGRSQHRQSPKVGRETVELPHRTQEKMQIAAAEFIQIFLPDLCERRVLITVCCVETVTTPSSSSPRPGAVPTDHARLRFSAAAPDALASSHSFRCGPLRGYFWDPLGGTFLVCGRKYPSTPPVRSSQTWSTAPPRRADGTAPDKAAPTSRRHELLRCRLVHHVLEIVLGRFLRWLVQ